MLQQSPCPQIRPYLGVIPYPQASPSPISGTKVVLSTAPCWFCTDGEEWAPAKAGNNCDVNDIIVNVTRRVITRQTWAMVLGSVFS